MANEVKLKQVQVSCNIAEGDLKTKLRHAQRFLDEGCRVRFELRLKGRENSHPDIGLERMKGIIERLSAPHIIVEKPATINGNTISAQLRAKG